VYPLWSLRILFEAVLTKDDELSDDTFLFFIVCQEVDFSFNDEIKFAYWLVNIENSLFGKEHFFFGYHANFIDKPKILVN
jgi:hypothetical protein